MSMSPLLANTGEKGAGLTWLGFAMLTVMFWGLYGVFLHTGRVSMADAKTGLFKAFLFVGVAYFITAVLAPLLVLYLQGANWSFTTKGVTWSLLAGTVGAAGAFFVLMAFGAQGKPAVVMAIIFAGAPIVNAIVALIKQPPANGFAAIPWQFYLGVLFAAAGGCLVTLYKPH